MSRQITTKFSTKFKSKNIIFSASTRFKSKHYFATRGNCYKFCVQNPNIILRPEEIATNFGYKFKTTNVILMHLEILLYKHKAVIKVPEVVTQTVNRK